MTKILVSGALHPDALTELKKIPNVQIINEPDCEREKLEQLIADAHVLVCRSETDVDQALLEKAPKLKIIARAAVGVGNIDLQCASDRGVLVINTPGMNTNSAAELTLGLMISLLRHIPLANNEVKKGGWDRHRFSGNELRGKTLGIVGLGNVGHRVAKFAHGFDMKVFGYDPYISPQLFVRYGVTPCAALEDLVASIQILTLHVPLNSETKGMITLQHLKKMQKGSYLINAARGGLVLEADLLACLESGQLKGVGIDTWEKEPKPWQNLVQHPRVVCTPHIGASTAEAQKAIADTVVTQVKKALEGGVVDYPVNLPDMGVLDNPLVKPYTVLAEKLGSFTAQIIEFNPCRMKLSYRGDLAGIAQGLVRLGWMKGYASQAMNDYVSYVNAEKQFARLGVELEEDHDAAFDSYRSAFSVSTWGDRGEKLTIGGIVFENRHARISLIDEFEFEEEAVGSFLLVKNQDKPGVVGAIGSMLAREGVNINSFRLSRSSKGGDALALIRLDGALEAETLERIRALEHIKSALFVTL